MTNSIKYLEVNDKCNKYISDSINDETWLTVLEGGKRASKNVLSIMVWAFILESHPDKLHLCAGFSLATAETNIIDSNGFGLEHIFKGRCKWGKYKENKALTVKTTTGEKIIIVVGGGKADSYKRIKGNTYGTAYLDEANEMHESFVREVTDRLISSARLWYCYTLNPKSPDHWFYKIIDNLKDMKGYIYSHFTLNDNPSISDERKTHILSTYDTSSVWYRRDIKGERVAAEGLIYRAFADNNDLYLIDTVKPQDYEFVLLGIDYGGNKSGHAINATGILKGFKGVHTIKDFWSDKKLDPDQLNAELVRFIDELEIEGFRNILTIYADSAEQVLIRGNKAALIKARKPYQIKNALKGAITDRINFYSLLMGIGAYKIHKRCKHTIEAYNTAIWDPKHPDERLDDGTTNIDSIDAQEYSTEKYMKQIIDIILRGVK